MSRKDTSFDIGSLSATNREQLLHAIEPILEEYVFADNGVVRLAFKTMREADAYIKQHRLLARLSVVTDLEELRDYKFNESSAVSLYFSPDYDGLLRLKSALSDKTAPSKQAHNPSAKLSLDSASKKLRLTAFGTTVTIKKFTSKGNDNYIMFKQLYLRPNEALTRVQMGVSKGGSDVKDIPKTMGFINAQLKNIFFTTDRTNQTLALHPQKVLTPDEIEIIRTLVNSENYMK